MHVFFVKPFDELWQDCETRKIDSNVIKAVMTTLFCKDVLNFFLTKIILGKISLTTEQLSLKQFLRHDFFLPLNLVFLEHFFPFYLRRKPLGRRVGLVFVVVVVVVVVGVVVVVVEVVVFFFCGSSFRC